MRRLILFTAILALAWARPETYRETEDFKYSRSSSDEGSKSGYYGAQRGNMAGNYERAHNMDSLAQNQMSGAINQVEGELGDASKTRAGSVYTSANSRGVYGSGRFDLSNLQGRNFGESSFSDSSHSSQSAAYQHSQNSDWRSQSQRAAFGASDTFGQSQLRAEDGATGHGASYYGGSNSHSNGYQSSSGYNSHSGYHSQSNFDDLHGKSSSGLTAGDQSHRYIITPVRIVGRPGTQIAIPVYGQAGQVYDAQKGTSSFGQSSRNSQSYTSQKASSFDQNAINSEAEVLNNDQQHVGSVPIIPVPNGNGKHYSSSYNYHKAWERRSETTDLPLPDAPTVSPLSKHSELNEDVQAASETANLQEASSRNSYSGHAYNSGSRYNSHSQLGSSQSRHESDYGSQHRSQSDTNANHYAHGTYGSIAGLASLPTVDSQPKSYQSAYSYHKSWEKQGDPYVIVPATNEGQSQIIVSGATKNGASSHNYGTQSHQHYSQGEGFDCDTLCRHRRAVRSYRSEDYYQQNQEDLGQQTQSNWDVGQQSQQLEDLGQQTQQSWGKLHENRPQKLEDLGQQTQQSWGNFQQQSQSEKLEDLGQQTQQSWGNFQQQSPSEKLEDLGQQTQQSWGNFQQENRPQKLEDLGQQTQQSWADFQQQSGYQKLEDFGQQTQGKLHESESKLEDLSQQTQQSWDKSNNKQQANDQILEDLGQQTQGHWDKAETDSQQSQQHFGNLDYFGQETQSTWDTLGHIEHQNVPQQTEDLGQHTQTKWDTTENMDQQVQTQWNSINTTNKTRHTGTTNTEQQTQTQFETFDHIPNTVHAEHNTFNNENSNVNNPNYRDFWSFRNGQRNENSNYNYQQNSFHNQNSSSNSQTHYGASWPEQVHKDNAQSTNNNPLQSLWDKIDNMEQQSEHSSNENKQQTDHENSHNFNFGQKSNSHQEHNWEHRHNSSYHQNQHETHYYPGFQPSKPSVLYNTTIHKPNIDQKQETTTKKSEDDLPEQPEEAEIGRGDIGLEDDASAKITTPKTISGSQTYATQSKPQKTPEEIEALSLTRGTEEGTSQSDSLGVLSLSQQKWLEDQRRMAAGSSLSTTTSTTTSRSVVTTPNQQKYEKEGRNIDKNTENGSTHSIEILDEIQQHNTEIQSQDTDKSHTITHQHKPEYQLENHEVQSLSQQLEKLGHRTDNVDQQSTGQELENFNQQNQDLDQHDLEHFEQHSQNFNQNRRQGRQDLVDFGQKNQDLSQQNEHLGQSFHNFEQQNTGHDLEDVQQTQDLHQQNLQHFQDLGQHNQRFDSKSIGQQMEDFGQQSQDLSQQNLHQFHNLGQHNQNFEQQNTGQQLEDFGQQTQDLNQENLETLESFGQQTQNQPQAILVQSNTQPIEDQKISEVSVSESQSHAKQDVEIVPPLATTEKPGFWKSVGNKFTNAKDSVTSWFSRS